MRGRGLLVALGTAVGVYGAWLLLSRQDLDQLVNAAIWLVAGPVLHDVALSAAVVAVCALGARLVPRRWRAPATVVLVVVGTVTIAAVPVLGRFGARADNPTLLDRPYLVGWVALVAVVVLGTVLGSVVASRRRARRPGA